MMVKVRAEKRLRVVVTSYMVIIMYPIIIDPSTLLTFFTWDTTTLRVSRISRAHAAKP